VIYSLRGELAQARANVDADRLTSQAMLRTVAAAGGPGGVAAETQTDGKVDAGPAGDAAGEGEAAALRARHATAVSMLREADASIAALTAALQRAEEREEAARADAAAAAQDCAATAATARDREAAWAARVLGHKTELQAARAAAESEHSACEALEAENAELQHRVQELVELLQEGVTARRQLSARVTELQGQVAAAAAAEAAAVAARGVNSSPTSSSSPAAAAVLPHDVGPPTAAGTRAPPPPSRSRAASDAQPPQPLHGAGSRRGSAPATDGVLPSSTSSAASPVHPDLMALAGPRVSLSDFAPPRTPGGGTGPASRRSSLSSRGRLAMLETEERGSPELRRSPPSSSRSGPHPRPRAASEGSPHSRPSATGSPGEGSADGLAEPAPVTITGITKGRSRAASTGGAVVQPQPPAAPVAKSVVTVHVRQVAGTRSRASSRESSVAASGRPPAAAAGAPGGARHHSTATLFPDTAVSDAGDAVDVVDSATAATLVTPKARAPRSGGVHVERGTPTDISPRSGGSPGAASTATSLAPRLLSGRLASSAAASVTGPLVRSLEAGGLGGSTVLTPSRQRSTGPVRLSNHRRIVNALGLVFFAGPANADKLKVLRRVVEDCADRQLLLALASTGTRANGTLVGMYAVVEVESEAAEAVKSGGRVAVGVPSKHVLARRVWGTTCPPILLPPMVRTLLKFDTAARAFREVGFSVTLTVTTDAVGIDTAFLTSASTHSAAATGGSGGGGGAAASVGTRSVRVSGGGGVGGGGGEACAWRLRLGSLGLPGCTCKHCDEIAPPPSLPPTGLHSVPAGAAAGDATCASALPLSDGGAAATAGAATSPSLTSSSSSSSTSSSVDSSTYPPCSDSKSPPPAAPAPAAASLPAPPAAARAAAGAMAASAPL